MTPATLAAIMSALRTPGTGCPWDLAQDHQSLARYLREEAAEVLDALAHHTPGDEEGERHLCEELGDLWLQVAFHAQLAQERGAWDLHEVERTVVAKLIRRHPHVFEACEVADADEVLVNWKAIKRQEKGEQDSTLEPRVMEGIPKALSPLEEAMEIGKRCAKVGFEWPDMGGVLDKVKEEIAELQAESDPQRVEDEFGDVLFSLIQWARKMNVDPDRALRRQMRRFKDRFAHVEDFARESGGWEQQNLDGMEAAWQRAKLRLRAENQGDPTPSAPRMP